MDNLGATGIGDRFSVRRPHDAADAHIVVRDGGLCSVGKPPDNEIASFSRTLLICAVTSHERDAFAVRGRDKPAAGIRLAPRRLGIPPSSRNLPQTSLRLKINAV